MHWEGRQGWRRRTGTTFTRPPQHQTPIKEGRKEGGGKEVKVVVCNRGLNRYTSTHSQRQDHGLQSNRNLIQPRMRQGTGYLLELVEPLHEESVARGERRHRQDAHHHRPVCRPDLRWRQGQEWHGYSCGGQRGDATGAEAVAEAGNFQGRRSEETRCTAEAAGVGLACRC